MQGNFRFNVKPSAGPGDAPIGALPSLGGGLQLLNVSSCDVAGEIGLKTVFVKKMRGNFRFTIERSAGSGDALTGLGGGFYFIVYVSLWLHALCKTMMPRYKG